MKKIRRRPAYTLLELSVSMVMVALLSVGLSSALLLMTRCLSASDTSRAELDSTARLAELAADLREAKSVSQYTAQQLAMTVADRTGDGTDDSVSYQWSGVAGAPVTRSLNGGASQVIVPSAHAAWVESQVDTKTATATTSTNTSVVHVQLSSSSTKSFEVTSSNQTGQYFVPALPSDAVSWRPTAVSLSMRRSSGATGMVGVIVYQATPNGWPTGTMVGSSSADVSTWSGSGYAMRIFTLAGATSLSPTQGVTVIAYKGTVAANQKIEMEYTSASGASGRMESLDSGASWLQKMNEEVRHSVSAAVEVPATTNTTRTLRWLRWQVQADAAGSLIKPLSAELLNRPQVP